jgi:hypothetical protein
MLLGRSAYGAGALWRPERRETRSSRSEAGVQRQRNGGRAVVERRSGLPLGSQGWGWSGIGWDERGRTRSKMPIAPKR